MVSTCALHWLNTAGIGFIQMFLKKRRQQIVRQELVSIRNRLWRFCLSRTNGNRADGDDLFQATAVRALEKAEQFEPGTKFDNWVFTIAVSVWRNELRSRKVRIGAGVVDAQESDLPATNLDGETNIFASEVLNKVMDLPKGQTVAVLLVYIEGYAYKEAAEIMDIPIGTVMSRLAAARQTLKLWADDQAVESDEQ